MPSVRLLPEYDAYVMGFREREQLVPPEVREQVAAHGKGRYEGPAGTPFLVVDGVCAGIWSRKKSAKNVELTVEPARKLTRAERDGVQAEAERIGAFSASSRSSWSSPALPPRRRSARACPETVEHTRSEQPIARLVRVLERVELEENENVVRVLDATKDAFSVAFSRACGRSWSNICRQVS